MSSFSLPLCSIPGRNPHQVRNFRVLHPTSSQSTLLSTYPGTHSSPSSYRMSKSSISHDSQTLKQRAIYFSLDTIKRFLICELSHVGAYRSVSLRPSVSHPAADHTKDLSPLNDGKSQRVKSIESSFTRMALHDRIRQCRRRYIKIQEADTLEPQLSSTVQNVSCTSLITSNYETKRLPLTRFSPAKTLNPSLIAHRQSYPIPHNLSPILFHLPHRPSQPMTHNSLHRPRPITPLNQ